ncbi:MAG TPA: adenylate kinase [Mycobacterium sp.]|nr:adenylate kinase [Mycobacterium sp.]
MRVVLLGAPGSGKGTQAVKLSETLGVPQISTGDLFRSNIAEGTELGRQAKQYLDAGDLVPAELTNALVDDRLNDEDAQKGFILDGYPRSVEQAQALHDMLVARNTHLDAVLSLRVSESELMDRLMARGRADDTAEVIHNRLVVYREETAPLLDYYQGEHELKVIDALGAVDEVFARALQALGR